MGKVAIEGMAFRAYHGVGKDERSIGRDFEVDIYVDHPLEQAAVEGNVQQTVDYSWLYKCAKEEMAQTELLLETVCRRLALRIQAQYPQATGILVRIAKLAPYVYGKAQKAYVEYSLPT